MTQAVKRAVNGPELPLEKLRAALKLAIAEARRFQGATAPNPPVGAIALDAAGEILSLQAHEKAGTGHAEAKALEDCRQRGLLPRLHTLIITLEPCNHHGRTGPCTEAVLRAAGESRLKHVYYGVQDPNPRVAGQGAQRLREAGLSVVDLDDPDCRDLIGPFSHWIQTGLPWITLKTAYDAEGSMIPPPGQKTFSSPEALKFAHELRKVSDAILTGSGTVLADLPEFTVRHLPDHPDKTRWLAVLDRRDRTPADWIQGRERAGFRFYRGLDVDSTLRFLGSQGVLEVLVEAGPLVTQEFLNRGLWHRHVVITPQGIDIHKCLPASSKGQAK
jgi:diaminohydroxyphosphoribosylaminopyrimidine deaminase/5-amino-6-(5-phosphoribosylamino)uracil reductase